MKEKQISKTNKRKHRYRINGEAAVPEFEEENDGFTKFSMDFMVLNSEDKDKAKATMVNVNHDDGGVFAYAAPQQGHSGRCVLVTQTHGEGYWQLW